MCYSNLHFLKREHELENFSHIDSLGSLKICHQEIYACVFLIKYRQGKANLLHMKLKRE